MIQASLDKTSSQKYEFR